MKHFSVFTPEYRQTKDVTPNGASLYEVHMSEAKYLVSATPEAALLEARAMGFRNPIVGKSNVDRR